MSKSRPIFAGNLDVDTRVKDLERAFERYGQIERIDLKTGFAFVYLDGDGRRAVEELDGRMLPGGDRRMRVEFARGDGEVKRREDDRRRVSRAVPCETLFVVNFDTSKTRTRELEKAFEEFGTLKRVDMKKNFAFVEFSTVEEAANAMKALDGSMLGDRQLSVEYMAR